MRKTLLITVISILALCASLITVNAAGNVTATFTSSDSVNIGDTVTVNLTINSVEGSSDGKLYAFGGYVDYDPEYLEFVSYTGASGWSGTSNINSSSRLKISAVDFSLNQGVTSGNIATLTFRAIKGGHTNISMSNIEATDQDKNIDVTFTSKGITIIDPNNPLSSDSSLKSLDIQGYTTTPEFNSNTTSYTMNVPNEVTGLNVTAVPNDEKATVNISGNNNWVVGENTIEITVTAEDNSQTIYTVVVNRAAKTLSSNTNINLIISTAHTISPNFSNSINDYEVIIPENVTSLDMQAIPEDQAASVMITGNENFTDVNEVEITVTAEDGTIRVINLNVTKGDVANVNLADLSVDGATVTGFDPDTLTYTLEDVSNDKESIVIDATPEDNTATVTGTGTKDLIFGDNSFEIVVTAADGITKKTYTVNIARLMKGDINYDGRVSLVDIRLMIQKILNAEYTDQEKWVMDYNDDDRATLLDIRLFLQWMLNQ